MSTYQLDLCRNWKRIAVCHAYEFHAEEHWLKPGGWTLETTPGGISSWQPTGELVNGKPVLYGPRDVDGVRLVRDGEIAFTGMVGYISDGAGGFEVSADPFTRWTWSGPDLWGVLMARIAFPDPSKRPPPWPVGKDVRTAVASSAIAGYIQDNAGPGALEERRWPGLVVVDEEDGTMAEWSARLETLSDLAARIGTDGGVGVWISLDWDGTIRVRIGRPRDRQASLVLSDQGDVVDVHFRQVPPSATWAIAGGEGQMEARTFAVYDLGQTGAARREVFSDQSSLTPDELIASVTATAKLGDASWSVDAQVTDLVASQLRYGKDILLGDTISIDVGGFRYVVPVQGARFDITPDRQLVRPQLGTAAPNRLVGLIRDVANLQSRVNRGIA